MHDLTRPMTMYSSTDSLTPDQEYLLDKRPRFTRKYLPAFESGIVGEPDEGELPPMYRELVIACVLMAIRGPHEGIVAHLRRAFELGLSEDAALDAAIATQAPGGALALWAGIRAIRAATGPIETP